MGNCCNHPADDNKTMLSPGATIKFSHTIGQKATNFYDDYDVQDTLGTGSFGEVVLAKHKLTKIDRAVKIVSKKVLKSENDEELMDEIEILKDLVIEYYIDPRNLYIVTEYCNAGDLFNYITSQDFFTEKTAANIIQEILRAVNYLHQKKIVHRDLKPENILLQKKSKNDFSFKLIDFGTSKIYDPKKKFKEFVGTSYYIAPEIINGLNYDEKCDIFSCGVILYLLLCGYPPFNGDDDSQILKAIKKGDYVFSEPEWGSVSSEAKSLVKKMLERDSGRRISAEGALKHQWMIKFSKIDEKKIPNIKKNLSNLKEFQANRQIQIAVWNFLLNYMDISEEKEELLQTFKTLDANGDGKISREELINGYKFLGIPQHNIEKEVNIIMKSADVDQSGFIDYNEFIMASVNRKKMLSKENLDMAFKIFDQDGNGYITLSELKNIFSGKKDFTDEMWMNLVSEVDENKDNKVHY